MRLTWTFLILCANWSVLVDSPMAETSGFIAQMTDILALPDKEGCSILVNLEFRNGTWSLVHILSQNARANTAWEYYLLPLAEFSARVEITLPSVSKLYKGSSQHYVHFVDVQ